MEVIKIKNEALPGTLVTYKGTVIDVDGKGAGSTENGKTIRDVRRRNRNKIMLKFEGLTLDEFSEIMEMIDAPTFEVTFFRGKYITITAYAGDKNWEGTKVTSPTESRWKLEFNIIEL